MSDNYLRKKLTGTHLSINSSLGHEFEIIVSTSGRFAAGTDARVFIKLTGTEGVSDDIELKDSTKGKKLFEAGK